jgi:FtsH-binding integral membrane protein
VPAGPFVAVGGMAVALFLYAYAAIAQPSPLHSLVMPLVWVVLFAITCRWFTARPRAVLVLPVVAVAVWFVLLLI